MTKGSVHQQDTAILNMDAPNRVAKYVKQKLIEWKGEIDNRQIQLGTSTALSQQLIEQPHKTQQRYRRVISTVN